MPARLHNTLMRPAWLIAVAGLLPVTASGDAIVRTQAMFATTIAELYVEPDVVRLELEIGLNDLGAFRSLLPDDIHEDMGFGSVPVPQRIQRFMTEEFRVIADGE